MRRLVYRASAQRDIEQITIYVTRETGDQALGRDFIARLRARCGKLRSLSATLGTARPELGDGVRSTPANGYVIFFRYTENAIEIINILHGSRDVTAHFDPN